MGQHSVPRGEKSTLGAANASLGTKGYEGAHRKGNVGQAKVENLRVSRLRTIGDVKK